MLNVLVKQTSDLASKAVSVAKIFSPSEKKLCNKKWRTAAFLDILMRSQKASLRNFFFLSIKIGALKRVFNLITDHVCKSEENELTWQKIMAWAMVMAP